MKDYRKSHLEERISKQYEDVVYCGESYDSMLWKFEQTVLASELASLKEKVNDIDYLDFACGTGRITSFLEDKVTSSVGVDIAAPMIERAEKKTSKTKYILTDVTREKNIMEGNFDLITAFRFFLNAQNELRNEVLKYIFSKLKDDNSLFIFNVHGNTFSHRVFTKIWFLIKGRNLNAISYFGVKELLYYNNFEIVSIYGFGIIPKIFYRLMGPDLMYKFDYMLSRIQFLKYISYNLIFVCRKKGE